MSNGRWRFYEILWPSWKIQTLSILLVVLGIYNFDSCIEKDAEIKAGAAAAAAREPLVWSWLGHVVTYFSRAAPVPRPHGRAYATPAWPRLHADRAACATVPPHARPCCCRRRMRALVLMDPNFLLPPPTLVLPTAIYYIVCRLSIRYLLGFKI